MNRQTVEEKLIDCGQPFCVDVPDCDCESCQYKPQERQDELLLTEIVEECMPTIERFEEVQKQVFYPISAKELGCEVTCRIYASTMSREAVRKTLAKIREAVEGAGLTDEELKKVIREAEITTGVLEKSINYDSQAGILGFHREVAQAQTQASLKALEGE